MSNRTIFLNGQSLSLTPAQLIQAGGEGLVFGVGDTAVKLYHQPQPGHAAKLQHLLDSGLAQALPPHVLAPCALAADKRGQIIGFQMPRLPAGSFPIKKLANVHFRRQQNISTTAVLTLFQQMHATLSRLHQLGLVVGDLNDQNVFLPPAQPFIPYWIDVDSYQIGRYPCPVAMELFVDPHLYGIADLGQRSYFSPATDWYAFFVLLVRSLLGVHPYGGVHKQHKTLAARAAAGISILHPDVTYPATAVPAATLPAALRQHLLAVFEDGQRPPFPAALLADYAQTLAGRPPLPGARRATAVNPSPDFSLLLTVPGFIERVQVEANGRLQAIVRQENDVRLVRLGLGSVLNETPLFSGQPGYRYALFQNVLVVNPPGSRQLLLLDVSGRQPQKMQMLETALFRDTAVFAASDEALYRIAGNWIMRGSVQRGLYVEEAIATAHHKQTRFWAAPHGDTLGGYHRVFAENRYFLLHNGASYDVALPDLRPGESVVKTAVAFGNTAVAFWRKINWRGVLRSEVCLANHRGKLTQQFTTTAENFHPELYPFAFVPPLPITAPLPFAAEEIIHLHLHPQGVIAQTSSQLFFLPPFGA
ncbi:MAG: hypothetical protein KC441_01955 [Anaerolineales bacterium]|nr:hypothetical protein [Anaerolineales bacterium]